MTYPIYRKNSESKHGEFVLVAKYHGRLPDFKGEFVNVPLLGEAPGTPLIDGPMPISNSSVVDKMPLRLVRVIDSNRLRERNILVVPDDYELPDNKLLEIIETPSEPLDA